MRVDQSFGEQSLEKMAFPLLRTLRLPAHAYLLRSHATLPIIQRISSSAALTATEAPQVPGNGYCTISVQTETADKEARPNVDIKQGGEAGSEEPEVPVLVLKQIKLE